MSNRPTYSLQILLGTIAAFAVAAGAFGAPPSVITGLLVLIVATCDPALLVVVWRSGIGYRRSFVIGAIAPAVACAAWVLWILMIELQPPFELTDFLPEACDELRAFVLLFTALSLGGGLAGMGVHWLMRERESETMPEEGG